MSKNQGIRSNKLTLSGSEDWRSTAGQERQGRLTDRQQLG